MKANNLMIGDWVSYNVGNGKHSMPMKVCSINPGEICLTFYENEADPWYIDEDELIGIPLTESILTKNGFGYIERDEIMGLKHFYPGESHYCSDMDLHIGTGAKGSIYWLNCQINSIYGIRYVHELQHALRLCRIDKEIEL